MANQKCSLKPKPTQNEFFSKAQPERFAKPNLVTCTEVTHPHLVGAMTPLHQESGRSGPWELQSSLHAGTDATLFCFLKKRHQLPVKHSSSWHKVVLAPRLSEQNQKLLISKQRSTRFRKGAP